MLPRLRSHTELVVQARQAFVRTPWLVVGLEVRARRRDTGHWLGIRVLEAEGCRMAAAVVAAGPMEAVEECPQIGEVEVRRRMVAAARSDPGVRFEEPPLSEETEQGDRIDVAVEGVAGEFP